MKPGLLLLSFALGSVVWMPVTRAGEAAILSEKEIEKLEVKIDAQRFVLKNGLTLIVHEDHSAPLVAVNIWYHVGSKDEPKGKSGFAHLFEHLMFNGSENFDDDFFKATQLLGATSQNGTTNVDRTNYFQTVPKSALDSILWLESDRMGHLLGAIDQAKLDEQRAVVKNEKRQGENRPYAKAGDLIIRGTTPLDHPYGHSVIGSMEDLDAASLDDVRQWFRDYYGPSNAVIVLSGDISSDEALAKVEKYFGAIQPGLPPSRVKSWPVHRTGTIREIAFDRVAQPRLIRAWNISKYDSADTDYLQFLAQLLASDRNSRLIRRLVVNEQLATSVSVEVDNREIGGQFLVDATLKPDVDFAVVERAIDEEIQKIIKHGPTKSEMARVRIRSVSGFARSIESISNKAAILAESETFLGSPDAWKIGWDRFVAANPSDLQKVARAWLSDGDYVLHIAPIGNLSASVGDADRSALPEPPSVVAAAFPAVERTTLSNGMKLVVAKRSGAPVVNMTMLFNTGTPSDFASTNPLAGQFVTSLLLEGTRARSGNRLIDDLSGIGAVVSASGGGEEASVSLSAIKPTLPQALKIFAEVVRSPAFTAASLDRVKSQALASLASARADGAAGATRVFSTLMYGKESPYGRLVGEGDVNSLQRADLVTFHDRWYLPNNATLIVTGDTSIDEIKPLVEEAFVGWQNAPLPSLIVPETPLAQTSEVYLLDRPGAPQSVVRAAVIAPKRSDGNEIARNLFNAALGGNFTSRLNMKLREEKGWAYGASSNITGGRGSRVFAAQASVQADKTPDAVVEIDKLLRQVVSDVPLSEAEIRKEKSRIILGLVSDWSSTSGISSYLIDEVSSELPEGYYNSYAEEVEETDLETVRSEGDAMLKGRSLTWLIVGDLSKIEGPIRALGLADVRVIDADGNIVR